MTISRRSFIAAAVAALAGPPTIPRPVVPREFMLLLEPDTGWYEELRRPFTYDAMTGIGISRGYLGTYDGIMIIPSAR